MRISTELTFDLILSLSKDEDFGPKPYATALILPR